jgi:hypothetical protein
MPPGEFNQELRAVSNTRALSDPFPSDNFVVNFEQLRNTRSIDFTWEGSGREYRFALYRANGEAVVRPTTVRGNSFTLNNPDMLTEGSYVWQVYERDRRGRWESLPGIATQFSVVGGEALIRTLPITDPGALYGNR